MFFRSFLEIFLKLCFFEIRFSSFFFNLFSYLCSSLRRFHEIVSDLHSRTFSGDLQPQQLFSNQHSGQRRQNLASLKKILGLLSGGDKVGILEELYSSHYVPSIAAVMSASQRPCLEKIHDRFNTASRSERKLLLSLVANAYSENYFKNLGLKFS